MTIVGHDQVQRTVAVEVTHSNGRRKAPGLEVPRRLKAPVPVAQEHRDVVGKNTADHSQVQHPIAIEVAYRNGQRIESGREIPRLLEAPIPAAQKH